MATVVDNLVVGKWAGMLVVGNLECHKHCVVDQLAQIAVHLRLEVRMLVPVDHTLVRMMVPEIQIVRNIEVLRKTSGKWLAFEENL